MNEGGRFFFKSMEEVRVGGNRFIVKRRLGAGSFGEIFLGEDSRTKDPVAIKLEPIKARSPQLFYESKLYLILSSGTCIPRFLWYGTESSYNILVMELLGHSLEELFVMCGGRFSLKTVLMIVDQTLDALEYLHNKNFIHRDVKPDNFMIGRGTCKGQIFAIDFGLAKKYRDPKTHEHLAFTPGKSLTGTARYASVNALSGYEQSRRDDLESLGYVWLYFLLGKLPWQGLQGTKEKQKYEMILDVKKEVDIGELCKDLPIEFKKYMDAVKSLEFDEEPHYSEYREMFKNLFINCGYVYDYQYDWINYLSEEERTSRAVRRKSINIEREIPSGFPKRVNSVPNLKQASKAPITKKVGCTASKKVPIPRRNSGASRGSLGRKRV